LFSTAGESNRALSPHPGVVAIVSGEAYKPFNATNAPPQNLLYLAIVLPGLQAHGSGSGGDYGKFITTLTYNWDTQAGRISVVVQWDRQTDTVRVANQRFTRSRGNVLMVRRQTDGQLVAQQVPSLGPNANHTTVLQHLREQLPTDALIASLNLKDDR
jgi:hypothetical protein